ncbi:alpha/beta hydrolase [Plantactinospora sp. WMMC1484]|uniref:alpha/beta hydrolase n=1 Tax=Plantactinospora sp. WMMC1484 TaxID=3404122 RepID=UPI003BF560CB
MDATFVLVHSPSVGPLTWASTAQMLEASGAPAIVPSLTGVADACPPYWRAVAGTVTAAMDRLPQTRPVVIVSHSNAGLFVPVVVAATTRRVVGCVFVDAALPSPAGPTPVAPPELLDFLRPKAVGGRLPQWTEWWEESEVAPMFPDVRTRDAVSAEQPRLPLGYYQELVPNPAGWDDRPCGYLRFSPPYEPVADDARQRGWTVDHLSGRHLHQVVDPRAVADRILAITHRWRSSAS